MSYDAIGERLSIVEEVDVKKERKFYEYIFLHKEVCTASLLSPISLLEIPGVHLIKLLINAIDDETVVSL